MSKTGVALNWAHPRSGTGLKISRPDQSQELVMVHQPTESKRLLSHIIADWACSLKYEHLSPAAIQAAKLF
jgi:hypothetical protein